VFAASDNGNVLPRRVLAGAHTALTSNQNLFVH
jgi:hypothetical protein